MDHTATQFRPLPTWNPRRRLVRSALYCLVVFVVAGCAGPGKAATAVSTPETTTATSQATATTSADAQPTGVLTLGPTTKAAEEPGTYQVFFDPPFTVTVPQGWRGEALADGYVYFEYQGHGLEGPTPPLVAVQRFDFMVDPVDRDGGATFPEDLIHFIASHPSLEANPISEALLAGERATVIDTRVINTNSEGDPPRLEFGFTPDFLLVHFADKSDVRFMVLDVDGTELVVTIEVGCCDQLTKLLPLAGELLNSMQFRSLVTATTTPYEIDEGWVELRPLGKEAGFWPLAVAAADSGFVVMGVNDFFSEDAAPAALFSADGHTWEVIDPLPNFFANGGVGTGDLVVLIGEDSESPIWTTTDGFTWRPVAAPELDEYLFETVGVSDKGFLALGDRFVREGDVQIGQRELWSWLSRDGLTWTRGAMVHGVEYGLAQPVDITATSEVWIAIESGDSSSIAWLSTDGVAWTQFVDQEGVFADADLRAVASGSSSVMAVGERYENAQVWVSETGEEWRRVPGSGLEGFIADVAAVPEGFVAVGGDESGGSFWESIDGIAWKRTLVSASGTTPITVTTRGDQVVVTGLGPDGEFVIWVRNE